MRMFFFIGLVCSLLGSECAAGSGWRWKHISIILPTAKAVHKPGAGGFGSHLPSSRPPTLQESGTIVLEIRGPRADEIDLALSGPAINKAPLGRLVGKVTGPQQFTWQVGKYVYWGLNDLGDPALRIGTSEIGKVYCINATYRRSPGFPLYASNDFVIVPVAPMAK